jgi:hypothetical protein
MENDNNEILTDEEINNLSFEEAAFYLQTLNQVKDYYDSVGDDTNE